MPKGSEVLSRFSRTMQSILRIGNINLKDDGGVVQLRDENDTAFADGAVDTLRFQGDNPTNAVTLTSPSGLSSDIDFVLPASDGEFGQVLGTDALGNLGFVDAGPGVFQVRTATWTQADTTPVAIFTPPTSDAIIRSVVVRVDDEATGGGNPYIEVGIPADIDFYFEEGDANLKLLRTYEKALFVDVDSPPLEIRYQVTLNGNGSTFGGKIFVVWFTNKT